MKGKGLSLAGSIVSIIFSFLGLIIASLYRTMVHQQEFIDIIRQESLKNGGTESDVNTALKFIENFSNIVFILGIIYLVIGLITLILILNTKKNNKKKMGIIIIIISILHVFTFRLVAFILLLIGGIQLTKVTVEEQPQRDEAFWNEINGQ